MPLIRVKEPRMLEEFRRVRRPLAAIVCALACFMWERYKKELWITEVIRDGLDTHGLLRAVDVRTRNLTKKQRQECADFINEHVEYDPVRPELNCCIYGVLDKDGKHWDHFHIQIHPRTRTKFWVVAE